MRMSEGWADLVARAERVVRRLDAGLAELERRLSLWGAAALVATALLALGALYVRPALEAVSHGVYYAQLSEAPLTPGDNPVAYRILTPLLAWLLGLRGNRILILNLLLAWATLALVYRHYRLRGRGTALALGYAAVLATTMPILFTIHVNGYTDAATYLLLFLLLVCGDNAWVFGGLVLLSLLNRESVAFMLPFLLLLRVRRNGKLWPGLAASAVAVAVYLGVRTWLGTRALEAQSAEFYLAPLLRDPLHWFRKASVAYYTGVFSAFKLLWALPLAALWLAARERRWPDLALLASAIGGALAQTVIAVDTSRMLCMAFPALLLALEALEPRLGEAQRAPALLGLVGVNLLVPQLYVAGNAIYVMQTLLGYLLTH